MCANNGGSGLRVACRVTARALMEGTCGVMGGHGREGMRAATEGEEPMGGEVDRMDRRQPGWREDGDLLQDLLFSKLLNYEHAAVNELRLG